jgi:hypothetical protein
MSLGLALWILVAPAADWSWTILDGPFDSAVRCEARREARLDADHTLCARLPVMRHHEGSEATRGHAPARPYPWGHVGPPASLRLASSQQVL